MVFYKTESVFFYIAEEQDGENNDHDNVYANKASVDTEGLTSKKNIQIGNSYLYYNK